MQFYLLSGHIEQSSRSIIVTHSTGQYTLSLFDSVLVQVCVESSHAHGLNIVLKLLQCEAIQPNERAQDMKNENGDRKTDAKKELIKVCGCIYLLA